MRIEVVLKYGSNLFDFTAPDEYDSMEAAEFDWLVGPNACDCERSNMLHEAGAIPELLGCNAGNNLITLMQLRPFIVH